MGNFVLLVYIYLYMPHVHNPECTRKVLRTRLKKKEIFVLENSPMKKTAADLEVQWKEDRSTCDIRG